MLGLITLAPPGYMHVGGLGSAGARSVRLLRCMQRFLRRMRAVAGALARGIRALRAWFGRVQNNILLPGSQIAGPYIYIYGGTILQYPL